MPGYNITMTRYNVTISAGGNEYLFSRIVDAGNIPDAINDALKRVRFECPWMIPFRPESIEQVGPACCGWNKPLTRPGRTPIFRYRVRCLSRFHEDELAEYYVWATCKEEAVNYVREKIGLNNIKIKAEECNVPDA